MQAITLPKDPNRVPSPFLELEIARGSVPGVSAVNKFGRAPSGIQTTITDIWDRADATPTQQLWTAPTQARVHAIASTDAGDDVDSGVGARTIRVYGLTSWSTKEVSEDIELQGATPVNTTNSYVIIHRMKVLTKGATSVNVGTITATAATDSTVTAQINPGEGQTQMAIYGVPSNQTFFVNCFYGDVQKASGGAADVTFKLVVNPEPDAELTNFLTKKTRGVQSTGRSGDQWFYMPPLKIVGPAIIKLQGIGSTADLECSGGFDGILIDN